VGTVRSAVCIGAITLASIVGCNTLSGANDLVAGETQAPVGEGPGGDDNGATATSSSSSSSSGAATSGSSSGAATSSGATSSSGTSGGTSGSSGTSSGTPPPIDSGAPVGSFLLNQTFDNADACARGTISNGGTATFDGAGGCLICATAAGDTIYTQTAMVTNGKAITLDTNVRRQSGAASLSVTITLNVGGASVGSGATVTNTFTRVAGGTVQSSAGTQVTASVGIKGAVPGDCIVADDLRVPIK